MPAIHLSDFSDRYSPMLVKELRQGLRAKTFIGIFLALQIFLAVMLLSASASASGDKVGTVVSTVIFIFFGLAVLVFQPLRGINALSSEVKGNTIDMMVLTRLSSWRIVFGKWVAIVSQSALLLSTIIPYLILRYFFGGMNLVGEVVFLTLMFITSMALTAVTVGLSGCHSIIIRALLPVIGLPVLAIMLLQMLSFRMMGRSGGLFEVCMLDSPESRIGVAVFIIAVSYLGASLLSLGASLIAPAAENHSLVRRLVALLLLAAVSVLGIFGKLEEWAFILVLALITVPAVIIALVEAAPLVATVCAPFVKRGPLGRALGVFFYPTWSSGVLFAVTIAALALIASGLHGITEATPPFRMDDDSAVILLALTGGLFFPAFWQMFFFRGNGQRIAHYLLILVGSFIILGVLSAMANAMNNGNYLWFFAWNPLAFLPMLSESDASDSQLLLAVWAVDLILAGSLLTGALIHSRKSATAVREAEASLAQSA